MPYTLKADGTCVGRLPGGELSGVKTWRVEGGRLIFGSCVMVWVGDKFVGTYEGHTWQLSPK